eukprot:1563935-Lingulodinium_polyedra.AAC.1
MGLEVVDVLDAVEPLFELSVRDGWFSREFRGRLLLCHPCARVQSGSTFVASAGPSRLLGRSVHALLRQRGG